ncbi:MAG TPA: hypothetical protein VFT57_18975 [Gemmatimonadaceae bacterium]|nr:hypothetical protein [Gemmatimonadaceae bacterium]
MQSLRSLLAVAALAVVPGAVHAQCRPATNTNEAKLLAFYAAPIVFSSVDAPERLAPGQLLVSVEVAPIPRPDPGIQQTSFCYIGKTENTRLAPIFVRPRIEVGLPMGFAFEASYVPPVQAWDAEPNLASFALSRVQDLPVGLGANRIRLMLRAHGTVGRVRGPITCPRSGLQTSDPAAPCYGSNPSSDTYHPDMFGAEGALSTGGGRISAYAGGGVNWLRPHFQVGFVDGAGNVDHTTVDVDLTRGAFFGGVTARLVRSLRVSAQLYEVPADATTWRFGLGYLIR